MMTRSWPWTNFAAVHLSLVVADIRKCFFLDGLQRHVPVIVKSRSRLIEVQATEEIEFFLLQCESVRLLHGIY